MDDYIVLIAMIIILILIFYPLYKYFKKERENFNPKDVGKAINSVKKFGQDIERMTKDLKKQTSDLKNLGKEINSLGPKIERVAKYPVELGNKLKEEVTKVADEAGNVIEKEFNKIKDEVEDMANEVAEFAEEAVGEIEKEVTNIIETIEKIPDQVVNLANEIFGEFFPKIFDQGWKEFKKYVIDPIIEFFEDVGEIFNKVGDVVMEIIETIANLPGCIPIYAFDAGWEVAIASLKTILPVWLKDIIRTINRYIVQPIIIPFINLCMRAMKFILEMFGFQFDFDALSKQKAKCYDFGPLDEVFEAFKEFFENVFDAVKDIFKFIPFDEIIERILEFLGLGKGKGKGRGGGDGGGGDGGGGEMIKDKAGKAAEFASDTLGNITDTVTDTLGNVMNTTTNALSSFGLPGLPTPGAIQLTPSFLKDVNLLRSLNIPYVNNILSDIIKFPSLKSFNILKTLKKKFFNKQGEILGVSNPLVMSKEDKARKRIREIKDEIRAMSNRIKKSKKHPSRADQERMKELGVELRELNMSLMTPKQREQYKQKRRERRKKVRAATTPKKVQAMLFR